MGCTRLRRWWHGGLRVSGGMGRCGVGRYLKRAPLIHRSGPVQFSTWKRSPGAAAGREGCSSTRACLSAAPPLAARLWELHTRKLAPTEKLGRRSLCDCASNTSHLGRCLPRLHNTLGKWPLAPQWHDKHSGATSLLYIAGRASRLPSSTSR